ncbi:O-antigen ligase family protein [Propylenella binzhouense]|uniref:O-antigen ligase domain-containing protein n=1 Tax=Propylenella binzhouense TaxID=2555902 RepID=A0A964WTY4_9HYPH|nr:O-antigen ligase family protein [Propylenella binzhouense]MYZ48484.1 O-antigen ligase domain-containing protein [Propylenella binzhouense]
MSLPASAVARPTGLPVQALSDGVLWLAVFSGGFVFYEPSPHELIFAAAIPVWFLSGLRLPKSIGPLVWLLLLYVAGGMLAMTQSYDFRLTNQPIFVAVTAFLAVTAFFYASLVAQRPDAVRIVISAYIAAAIGTSLLGMIGYFGLTPNGLFTLYDRAAGGFKDPNVFGPFLVFPFVILVRRILTEPLRRLPKNGGLALVILFGIFLSFSRAAWGLTVVSTGAMALFLFINERRSSVRARYIALSVSGLIALAVMLAGVLSLPAVQKLYVQRAQIVQDYDAGHLGRFERHIIGFNLMLEHPLGLGYAEFGKLLGEDEHDIWLKSLTTYGWLGFIAFLALTVSTILVGFPLCFRSGPMQGVVQVAYVVFVGHILVATVIDIDHWRHIYLLLGLIWGTRALNMRRTADLVRPPKPASGAGYREVLIAAVRP